MQQSPARILCLDVGDRRIGVAVSDPLGYTAQPLKTYQRVGYGPDTRHFAALAAQYQTDQVLCGLPRNMDGSQGGQAEKVRAFAAELEKAGLRIAFWDERLSTVTAEQALIQGGVRREQRREVVDKVAAAVILQAYLDAAAHNKEEQAMQEQENLVELVDEEGNPVQFVHLMTLEYEGHEYVLLTGADDEDGEESEVYILRIEKDDKGEDCYVTVEDEDLMQAVFDKFVVLSEQDEESDDEPDEGEDQ